MKEFHEKPIKSLHFNIFSVKTDIFDIRFRLRHFPSLNLGTVVKIYTPIFSFYQKRIVNIMISDLRPVSNESPGNYTFYRGIHEFLNPFIFEKITIF